MYTQFKFDRAEIAAAAQAMRDTLAVSLPGTDAGQFAAATMAERLVRAPARYLEYGPYWWSVKQALAELGTDFGPERDRVEGYGEDLPPYEALVAGERFKDFYRLHFLAGTSKFILDADGQEPFILFDSDMEARRLGRAGAAVAAGLAAVAQADEPENESAPGDQA